MVRRLSIITTLFVMLADVSGQQSRPDVLKVPLTKYFEPSDYQGGIQNWSFSQDSSGLLYVANNFGLLEFDGSTWTNYNVPNSTRIRTVYVDKQNRIFAGGQGQIGFFEKTTHGLNFTSLLPGLPEEAREIEEVWKIIAFDNQLFFNTSQKLLVLDGEEFRNMTLPGKIQQAFKSEDGLIVQFSNLGLHLFKDDQWRQMQGTSELTEEVVSILPNETGSLLFTRAGSIYHYSNQKLRKIIHKKFSQLPPLTINSAIRLSSGDIVAGTQNQGLLIFDDQLNLKQRLTKNRGLNNRTVLALLEDHFGNLWVGLNNGINYIELSSPLSLINEEVGLEGTGYAAALHANTIYLGTNNGLFTLNKSNTSEEDYTLIAQTDGLVNDISTVGEDLILNHHRGAFQIDDSGITRIDDKGSWKFIRTPFPSLAIGGDYNGIGLFRKIDGRWKKIKEIEGVSESSRVMEFENDSTLWMTHGYKGAYRIHLAKDFSQTKSVEFLGKDQGMPSNLLISTYQLDDHLIFAAETGIYDFEAESGRFLLNPFLVEQMGYEHVSEIETSNEGDIYFLQDGEMAYLKRESFGSYRPERNVFKRINKLLSDDLAKISILDAQNVLICAKDGFIHYNPQQKFEIHDEFNAVLKHIDVRFSDDSVLTFLGEFFENLKLERNHSIRFQYASPYFDGFEDLSYSYRLLGFNDRWSEWTTSTIKEYTNLPAGSFTFEVKARNIYESESAVMARSFRVLPKWYQSNWAYLGYIITALIGFGLISFYQDKRHKKEKAQLHQSKEEAIRSKEDELHQVSTKSRQEIENLKNEKLRSEIDHKNNELASATMHLLNKNEFVTGVRKRIETIVNENGSSKEELKRIIKTIDQNLKEDDTWDQFAYHFDQVHGDFLKNLSSGDIKLTPQETKLAAYLRMNMSSKEIANLMNISVRGVELARYRLRKKLKLTREQNLMEFLMGL